MKKLLHITECLGSGVLNYIKNITSWQVKDYDVYIAYATRPETPPNFMQQFDYRVHFIYVEGFTREIELKNDLKAFINVRKIIRNIQPDLIHLHSTKAGVIGRWAINCKKYMVFYSPHAYSFLMCDCGITKRFLYKTIEKLSDRKQCLTVTDIDSELIVSRKVTKNAICIANGIDYVELDGLCKRAVALIHKNTQKTICMLGKIVPQKNPELFNEIAQEFPKVIFMWIGAGPLANKLTSSNIQITGWLDRVEAVAKMMSADIFLFPSAWESLSMALMEAMYLEKPCIVSRADGNRDIIHTGINGYVCDTKEEYIAAISELLNDKEKIIEYGKRSRQDILNIYNINTMQNRYEKLFSDKGL